MVHTTLGQAGTTRGDNLARIEVELTPGELRGIRTEAVLHGTRSLALRQGSWIFIPKQGSGGKTVPEPAKVASYTCTAPVAPPWLPLMNSVPPSTVVVPE